MSIRSFVNSSQRGADTGAFRKLRLKRGRKDRLRERAITGKTPMSNRTR
jgi:hypothetical protein